MKLSTSELRRRVLRLKLVLTDSDGVLTDTGVYYSETGEALKRFSIRDGMGIERLRNAGVETAIITGEISGSVRQRAAKLQMPFLFLGVKDKKRHLEQVLKQTGLTPEQLAYIGDDVNDLEIIETLNSVGLTAAPADAMPEIQKTVHYRCRNTGGHGAFREFAELILAVRSRSGSNRTEKRGGARRTRRKN
jgi:3-deoxy-D-manno-octulosonate 8-phosphate phosphatase (KDO 8-P phosphatase)